MEPYYDVDGITIYCGDCREVLPKLGKFDLLLTDPPYGIGAGSMNFGMWRTSRMEKGDWDSSPPSSEVFTEMLAASDRQIIWGGNFYQLPPSRMYLVWDKGAGFRGRDFAECEQAWCSWDGNARIYSRDPLARGDYRNKVHPTQKPLALMQWCLSLVPDAQTVLDPFMGSGTTLVAARLEGRKAVGIELSEKYCESAVKRLSQGVLDFDCAGAI